MSDGTGYRLEPASILPERVRAYADLLSAVFTDTDKYTPVYLDWQYVQNPNGTVVGFDAWAGGTLAAHYVTLPVVSSIDGADTRGLLSLNTVTHPEHQGKGLFTKLAQATYDLGRSQGYRFVIGVANENSTHGFIKKLGWHLIAPLNVKVGIGTVHTHPNATYRLRAAWSPETLRWRLANPSATYRRRGSDIYARTGRFGVQAVMGLDKTLDAQLPVTSVAPLKAWIGIDRHLRLRGAFTELPRRMRSSPLNCIFKDLVGDLPGFGAEDIRFELLDFDIL